MTIVSLAVPPRCPPYVRTWKAVRRRSWDSQMGIPKSADGARLSSKPQLHLERGRTLGLLGYVSRDKVFSSKVEKLDEGRWLIVDFELM